MLFVGAVVHDGTNGYQEESFCVSSDNQNAEPSAGQMNFTQDSIEAPHRRVPSGHMVMPEAVAKAGGTQSDAAVAEHTGRPFC